MFNKTTNFIFDKYGEIINDISKSQSSKLEHSQVKIRNKSINDFKVYSTDVYVRVTSGIVMLVVSTNPESGAFEKFVIHRTIKIRAGIALNFISITANAKLEILTDFDVHKTTVATQNEQEIAYKRMLPLVNINEIFAYFYQVRNANYEFHGESHEYWELTFIDNGCLHSDIDNDHFELHNYDLVLYAPGQFHTQETPTATSCSYLTILFDMDIEHPEAIQSRVFRAQKDIHTAISSFMKVSNNELEYDSDLLIAYLKELIVKLLQYDKLIEAPVANTPMQQRFENELLNEVMIYITENIYEPITIEEITHKFSVSRSSLQNLFKNNLGVAPKTYISDLKLNKSKILIKESVYTISQIASILGFTSIHYFSRRFKQHFGMAPSEYAKTIYN
ncbi:MAG: AraC family transcriptional regulator [Erysipelotrichaceae bacterium]